jgi:hypothetical protein
MTLEADRFNVASWSTAAGKAAGPHLGTEKSSLNGHKGSTAVEHLAIPPLDAAYHLSCSSRRR